MLSSQGLMLLIRAVCHPLAFRRRRNDNKVKMCGRVRVTRSWLRSHHWSGLPDQKHAATRLDAEWRRCALTGSRRGHAAIFGRRRLSRKRIPEFQSECASDRYLRVDWLVRRIGDKNDLSPFFYFVDVGKFAIPTVRARIAGKRNVGGRCQ